MGTILPRARVGCSSAHLLLSALDDALLRRAAGDESVDVDWLLLAKAVDARHRSVPTRTRATLGPLSAIAGMDGRAGYSRS